MAFHFSSRLGSPAPENRLSRLKQELRLAGRPIMELSESNPTRVGLGAIDLSCLCDEGIRLYEPDPHGLLRSREALAADYASSFGSFAPRPDRLFLCASTSEAYGWLFKLLCDPGDCVLVPKPGYPLFDYLAGLEAIEPRPYRLEYLHPAGWRIDLDSVGSAMERGRVRALVLINPNNPTGSYVRPEERSALLGLCARFGCSLIVDEVFFGFPVEGGGGSSFIGEASVPCFVLDGLSKRLGLPQMKLGWIAASGPERELAEAAARLEILADAYLSAGTPVQNALGRLLDQAELFAGPCRERLASNLLALRSALEGPCSPHRVLRCEGGWTAIVESPRLASEEELAFGLLKEEGMASQPGYFFDMEREAFFTFGLILRPEDLERGVRAYAAYFERLLEV